MNRTSVSVASFTVRWSATVARSKLMCMGQFRRLQTFIRNFSFFLFDEKTRDDPPAVDYDVM